MGQVSGSASESLSVAQMGRLPGANFRRAERVYGRGV